MTIALLRRKGYARATVNTLAEKSENIVAWRNDKRKPRNISKVFRWGCTTSQNPFGVPVINKAESIIDASDKSKFRVLINEDNLCPPTFWNRGTAHEANLYPYVVRPANHEAGSNFYYAEDYEQLTRAIRAIRAQSHNRYYISQYIPKTREFRVFVAQGRILCVAEKFVEDIESLIWNVSAGGRFENVSWDNWPLKAVRYAREAFLKTSLDFAAIDVIQDAAGNPYVLEANTSPALPQDYRQDCMVKWLDWVDDKPLDRIEVIEARGGYRKFIHPCITDRARLVNE